MLTNPTNVINSYVPAIRENYISTSIIQNKAQNKLDALKSSNTFINSILGSLNSTLFIVDSKMRLIGFNDNNHLIFTRAEHEVIGFLFGKSCGCANANKNNGICGTTPACKNCNIRGSIVNCIQTKESTRNIPIGHKLFREQNDVKRELMFSTKYISYQEEEMVLVIIDDITELERQKQEIIKSRNEILGSIEYAKRIQQAVLPRKTKLNSVLGDHFVLYKPLNIVSGDFYYAASIGDWRIAIVADCTGHGVPGAFMSLLSITYLKEIIEKDGIVRPDIILNELRNSIIKALRKQNNNLALLEMDKQILEDVVESLSDGLDISVCVRNNKNNELLFAGANSSLYLVRNNEMHEYKGNRMPVGYYLKMDKFSYQKILTQKDDVIYMSSDGYYDQFGGNNGKKLKNKRFKEILVEISSLEMKHQGEKLLEVYNSWKAKEPQIDDVCVIGIRTE